VARELAAGTLVELLPSIRPSASPIWAVIPSGQLLPARVRALIDVLEANLATFPAAPTAGRSPGQAQTAASLIESSERIPGALGKRHACDA